MKTSENINPMLCDPETGTCEVTGSISNEQFVTIQATQKPVRLLYFTDPICSSCWGIEPELRKLKLEYGDYFEIEYRMGGLLKSWDSYGGRDVANPKEVAKHWDEASAYYNMPIDGDVWLEDPLHSSYPPSVAFKAAQLQNEEKALNFLRKIKEMLFLDKKNMTRWEHLERAAQHTGLDVAKLKRDFDGQANQLFEEDLTLARQLGVRGFPSIFFTDADANRFLVYGSKSYESYEQALLKLYPDAKKKQIDASPEALFAIFPTMTTKEFAVISGKRTHEAEEVLDKLAEITFITKQPSKNGPLWVKN